jgi:hypothetical protein
MQRGDLPESLGSAFGVAAARKAGTSRGRLRARDLERPFYGARAVAGAELIADEDADARRAYPRSEEVKRIHTRAAQYAPVMTEGAFYIGITACALWDGPLPSGLFHAGRADEPTCDPDVLEVGVHWPRRAPRGAGVNGHALRPALVHAVVHPESRLPVASPASTWALLARVLPHPYDLVAVADRFVRIARPPHRRPDKAMPPQRATTAQLAAAVDAGRREGIERLRAALPLVRTGAASRTETWTRLTLVDGGLPEPLLDYDVYDEVRRFIARVDMAYPQWKIVIEYEGEHHNSADEWEHNIDRYAALEAEGWLIIRVTRSLLFTTPDKLVARVRGAISRRSR